MNIISILVKKKRIFLQLSIHKLYFEWKQKYGTYTASIKIGIIIKTVLNVSRMLVPPKIYKNLFDF